MSPFFSWYQNTFLISESKSVFSKEHFFIQLNLFLLYEIFIKYFSGEYIWSPICIYKSQNFTFSM